MFLSANEKCWLLLTTSGRFFQKDLIINHSTCLFFVRYLEESLKVWNWKVLEGIGRFHCNYKINYCLHNSSIYQPILAKKIYDIYKFQIF